MYKLAKHLNKLIQLYIPLPNVFNVKSSVHLIEDLLGIPYKQGIRFVSLDIENMYRNIENMYRNIQNMYRNIPINELVPIIEGMSLRNQLDEKTTNELIKIARTVLEQNYFTFRNESYSQTTGLAMGAPSSAIFSEVYLQYLKHTKIVKIIT